MCCALELTLVDKDAVTSFKFWSHRAISMVEELKKVKKYSRRALSSLQLC